MGLESPAYASQSRTRRRSIPLLAPLIERPAFARWVLGLAVVHFGLAQARFSGLGCMVHDLTGIPCPGCGLTTACLRLLSGDWQSGFALHPFAPLFLLALAAIFLGAVLPGNLRREFAARVADAECRHGLTFWLAGSLLTFWFIRLIFP